MVYIKSIEIGGWKCIPCREPASLVLKNLGKLIVIIGDNASGKSSLAHALYIAAKLTYAKYDLNETAESPKELIFKLLERIYGFTNSTLRKKIFYQSINPVCSSCNEAHIIVRTDKGDITIHMKNENDIEIYEPSGFDSIPDIWDYVTAKFPLYFYDIKDIEYFIENIDRYPRESKSIINNEIYSIMTLYLPEQLLAEDPNIGRVPLKAIPAGSYSFSILRRIIKLVTEKKQCNTPFILLEEPEMGLNPLKQLWSQEDNESTLYGLFRKLINSKNDFTLVLTTQSPYVISTIAKLIEDPEVNIDLNEVSVISSCALEQYEELDCRHCRYQKFKYDEEIGSFAPVDNDDNPIDNPICESTFVEASERILHG